MAIGLDIGSSAVRAVQLERRRGKELQLANWGEVELPEGAVVDGDVIEPQVVTEALRKLWGQAGLRRRTVAVGLASQRVTVRQMDLPDLSDDELADAIRLQAQDQVPIPIDEALLDYVVVERYDAGDERKNVRVLLVAVERDMVDRLLAAVTGAKLRPALVDLDAFAVLRSLVKPQSVGDTSDGRDRIELLVDIGAMVTKIAVHRGGNPLFVRMVRLGGDAATRELQNVLELSWAEAEKAKRDASVAVTSGVELDPDDERARVLKKSVDRVVTEVRHSLEFFRREHDDLDVQRVLISGGASLTPNLAARLHAVLELPIDAGDPLRGLDGGEEQGEAVRLRKCRPFLAVPIGLAMGLLT